MVDKRHVVVVCGYGCHIDTPLRPYLDRVARFVLQERPDLVILCGGETQQQSAPNVSEAGLMLQYLSKAVATKPYPLENIAVTTAGTLLELEQYHYTTYENIQGASRHIRSMYLPGTKFKITIFCEAQRALKVALYSRHFMMNLVDSVDDIKIETDSWERTNPAKEIFRSALS